MNFKSFDEMLSEYLKIEETKKELTADHDWWYASELGRCKRQQFFRRLGAKRDELRDVTALMIAMDGTAMHKWREEAAASLNCIIETEASFSVEEYRFKGRIDLLAVVDRELCVIDIKTQSPKAFGYRSYRKEKIDDFQMLQVGSYILFMRRKYPKLNTGILYYYDRAYGKREEHKFILTDDLANRILKELEELNTLWNSSQLPKSIKPHWNCKLCAYRALCSEVDRRNLTFNEIKSLN